MLTATFLVSLGCQLKEAENPSAEAALHAAAQLMVFLRIEGTVPNWANLTLASTRMDLSGSDEGLRRYSSSATQNAPLTIPRSALGVGRFLVAATIPAGRIDQILLTPGPFSLTTAQGATIPLVVSEGGSVLLQGLRPIVIGAGQTLSLVATIRLGVDAVLARGVLSVRPTLASQILPAPTADNFLNGGEILLGGVTETFPALGLDVRRSKILEPTAGDVRDLTLRVDNGAPSSFTELRGQNEALWRTQHGRLNPELVQRLASLTSTAPVLADVYLGAPARRRSRPTRRPVPPSKRGTPPSAPNVSPQRRRSRRRSPARSSISARRSSRPSSTRR